MIKKRPFKSKKVSILIDDDPQKDIIKNSINEDLKPKFEDILNIEKYENGIKLSLSKSFFAITDFRYLGFEFSKNTVRLTQERISGILKFPTPQTKKCVMRLAGTLNYISSFYPNLANDMSILTDLLQKDKNEGFCACEICASLGRTWST